MRSTRPRHSLGCSETPRSHQCPVQNHQRSRALRPSWCSAAETSGSSIISPSTGRLLGQFDRCSQHFHLRVHIFPELRELHAPLHRAHQGSCKIKSGSVDVEFLDIETQRIHDQASCRSVVGSCLIANPGVVPVGQPIVGQSVICCVVDSWRYTGRQPQRDHSSQETSSRDGHSRAFLSTTAFSSVIVDHVDPDLDIVLMQLIHHPFELIEHIVNAAGGQKFWVE